MKRMGRLNCQGTVTPLREDWEAGWKGVHMDIIIWFGGLIVRGLLGGGVWAIYQTVRENRQRTGKTDRPKYPPWGI